MAPTYHDSDTLELPGRRNEIANEIGRLGMPLMTVSLNAMANSIEIVVGLVPAEEREWYLAKRQVMSSLGFCLGDVKLRS